jgi:diguanylate cyclase (GGDEF)-like protein
MSCFRRKDAFPRKFPAMMFSRRSRHELDRIAEAVASSVDLPDAFDTLVREVSRALQTRACVFEHREDGWRLLAQARGGVGVSVSDLNLALNGLSHGVIIAAVDLRAIRKGIWTSVRLKHPLGSTIVLLVAGDWTKRSSALEPLSISLAFAFSAIQEREAGQRAERLLVDEYTMVRRLTRLGSVEMVCQRIVDQVARSVDAGRVALALYRPEENVLVIPATLGYPASVVKDVRVEPGSSVIGHVFTSGRTMMVSDTRKVPGMSGDRRQYRTFSFAAVPLFAGTQAIGVLCATDKIDGSAFERKDVLALRTLSAPAALALMAARSDIEMHRLAYAATVDSLTGLFNRTYLEARLHQEVERARRGSATLALLLADVDDFKTINDTYGHQTGDSVLRVVGNILRSTVRVFDVCARYGGDEFAIVMPSIDYSSARACAERIRECVAEHHRSEANFIGLPPLTMSIGISVMEPADTPTDLIGSADRYLYRAKAQGKNCVCATYGEVPGIQAVPRLERSEDEKV